MKRQLIRLLRLLHLFRHPKGTLTNLLFVASTCLGLVWSNLGHTQSLFGPGLIASDQLRLGSSYVSESIRALQEDDDLNPAFLWIEQGQKVWTQDPTTSASKSCQSCHGDVKSSMTGVALKYPQLDAQTGGLINLESRINRCREVHQHLTPLAYESDELLALTALITWTSRSVTLKRQFPPELWPALQRGQLQYETRRGQSNLACMHCHTQNPGQHLGGETLSQGQPVGYPAYRLEWQKLGSLQRRLRACLSGVRARIEPFGSERLMELELFLNYRAQGLPMESPAVRR